jgi:hypothetical protein
MHASRNASERLPELLKNQTAETSLASIAVERERWWHEMRNRQASCGETGIGVLMTAGDTVLNRILFAAYSSAPIPRSTGNKVFTRTFRAEREELYSRSLAFYKDKKPSWPIIPGAIRVWLQHQCELIEFRRIVPECSE